MWRLSWICNRCVVELWFDIQSWLLFRIWNYSFILCRLQMNFTALWTIAVLVFEMKFFGWLSHAVSVKVYATLKLRSWRQIFFSPLFLNSSFNGIFLVCHSLLRITAKIAQWTFVSSLVNLFMISGDNLVGWRTSFSARQLVLL